MVPIETARAVGTLKSQFQSRHGVRGLRGPAVDVLHPRGLETARRI